MFTSIHFDKYKSFATGKNLNTICDMKRVNVFIGKNNSGKSSILDVISCVYDLDCLVDSGQKIPTLEIGTSVNKEHIDTVFTNNRHWYNYGNSAQFCSTHGDFFPFTSSISVETLAYSREKSYRRLFNPSTLSQKLSGLHNHLKDELINASLRNIDSTIRNHCFKRLSAERNIVPEPEDASEFLDAHGKGASSLIAKFLTHDLSPEKIIEEDLLNALNEIMYPDAKFQSIRVQNIGKDEEQKWEVFLQEKGCERFPLSQSGSGLKTIILLLLNLLVIPETEKYKDKDVAYGFEELENNLHPYLQRKIFEYIYNFAETKGIYVFITTHSHIAINAFFDKENAAIYHVAKQNNISTITKIQNHIDKIAILHDLDVKASDLFQANGIIWVEGHTDKIYIKRWLEVFCDCKYQEGIHYQFLCYGGSNLSHYTYTDGEVADLINILTTNPNAAIVMDRDRRDMNTAKDKTKRRVEAEFRKHGMLSWITQGTEIENYVSVAAINNAYNWKLAKQCAQYEKFPEYIETKFKGFSSRKVAFAHKVKNFISAENSESILDLKKRIVELYSQIEAWNE